MTDEPAAADQSLMGYAAVGIEWIFQFFEWMLVAAVFLVASRKLKMPELEWVAVTLAFLAVFHVFAKIVKAWGLPKSMVDFGLVLGAVSLPALGAGYFMNWLLDVLAQAA